MLWEEAARARIASNDGAGNGTSLSPSPGKPTPSRRLRSRSTRRSQGQPSRLPRGKLGGDGLVRLNGRDEEPRASVYGPANRLPPTS